MTVKYYSFAFKVFLKWRQELVLKKIRYFHFGFILLIILHFGYQTAKIYMYVLLVVSRYLCNQGTVHKGSL